MVEHPKSITRCNSSSSLAFDEIINEAPSDQRPVLLLINSGRSYDYRGWVLRSISRRFRLWLLSKRPASWEIPYILGQTLIDALNVDDAIVISRKLAAQFPVAGVLCYDEMRITQAAQVAEALALPTASSQTIQACRDKHLSRRLMGQVKSIPVPDAASARIAANQIGYPVILKPRALAASEGVVKVNNPAELDTQFPFTAHAHENFSETARYDKNVLVEEYLDGPEIAVDCVVWRGEVWPAFISHKRLEMSPTFEETGHLVTADDPLLTDSKLLNVVQQAHRAVGFQHGITHVEVRLTPNGPRIVELNGRLGGDLITYVGLLATGIDLALAAAEIATGHPPNIKPRRRRTAAVRYVYPKHNMVLEFVRIHTEKLPRGIWKAKPLARPGSTLLRPPASFVAGRAALGFAVGEHAGPCERALEQLPNAIEIRGLQIP